MSAEKTIVLSTDFAVVLAKLGASGLALLDAIEDGATGPRVKRCVTALKEARDAYETMRAQDAAGRALDAINKAVRKG